MTPFAAAPTTEPDKSVEIPGGTLGYWDTGGDGEVVVLLHAATHCARTWGRQRSVFAAAGYRVIGYSRRGHRGSSPLDETDLGIASGDLEALLDRLAIPNAHLVGVAGGGFVATDYAFCHPEKVDSLVIACSMMGITDAAFWDRIKAIHPPGFLDFPHEFIELGPTFRAAHPDAVAEWLTLHHEALAGAKPGIQGLATKITLAGLGQLTTPTLLIGGGSDLIVPPPLMAMAAEHMRAAEFVVLGDCGHTPHWESATAFNESVLGFLARTPDRSLTKVQPDDGSDLSHGRAV